MTPENMATYTYQQQQQQQQPASALLGETVVGGTSADITNQDVINQISDTTAVGGTDAPGSSGKR